MRTMTTTGIEYTGFDERRRIARRRRNRILLPIVVVVAMLLALVGIAIYDYRAMRTDALALSKGVVINLQERIETEMNAFLGAIPGLAQLSRDLLANVPSDGPPRVLAEALGIGMLNATPQLTALFFGTEDGHFLMVRRYTDGQTAGLETKIIRASTTRVDDREIELTRRDARGTIVGSEIKPWDQYDPRTRPWYQGARDQSGVFWTDVYPFFTGRTAGVTASIPLQDNAGQLKGVLGVDIALDSISRFLATLNIGTSGIALVVDDQGRLIAHPRASPVREGDDGKLRLTLVDDLDDDAIVRAFDRYRVEGHGGRNFELDGRRYIMSASSLRHLVQRDWSILVVVPENDFVGFVVDNVGNTLVMGLSVIALAALLASLLIRQGLRDDRAALRILDHEAELTAQGEAFGRLATSAADRLDEVTEALAQATGARRAAVWRIVESGDALACIDCFDSENEGHTQGTRLASKDHRVLIDALAHGETLRVTDAAADPRTAPLQRHYLTPLGCRALLAVPVGNGDRLDGAVWLEDGATRTQWSDQTLSFLSAIANLLALRSGAPAMTAPVPMAATLPRDAVADVTPGRKSATRVAGLASDGLDASLDRRRAAAFSARFAARGASRINSTEVIDALAVLAMRFTDAAALAVPVGTHAAETTMAELLRELRSIARRHDIVYLKALADQVVASVDPDETAQQGLRRLIAFALAARDVCESLLGRHDATPAFRIGIDFGPAISGVIGHDQPSFTLWGEAVQTAVTMADTSLPGAIQVTQPVYDRLRQDYLFQLRGHHYAEGVGEFSTYLLQGRL